MISDVLIKLRTFKAYYCPIRTSITWRVLYYMVFLPFPYLMVWIQKNIRLSAKPRGFHLITNEVLGLVPELNTITIGLFHLFIQHTSASISLNENADPSVRRDMETSIERIVPENAPYSHDDEGPDDMVIVFDKPAHVKSSIFGASLTIPISHGRLATGTWQGIWLGEHRNQGGSRKLVVTIQGQQ